MKKYLDLNGLLYFWNKIKLYIDEKLGNKVDKVTGKGLSTNDYTTLEKQKLAGLNNYTLPKASSTVLGGVKVGSGLEITDDGILNNKGGGKADSVDWNNVIGRPTNVSEFTNDAEYQTKENLTAALNKKADVTHTHSKSQITDMPTKLSQFTNDAGYIKTSEVDNKLIEYAKKTDISTVYKFKGSVENYAALPTSKQEIGDTYNIKLADKTHNIKAGDNVVWTGEEWDNLAGVVDLSEYMLASNLVAITNGEIDGVID